MVEQSRDNSAVSQEAAPDLGVGAEPRLDELSLPKPPAHSKTTAALSPQALRAREYLQEHPDDAIVVVATIQGEPRGARLSEELPSMLSALDQDITVLGIDYATSESLQNDFGPTASSPLSVLFKAADRGDTSRDNLLQRGPMFEGVGGLDQVVLGKPVDYINALRGMLA